MTRNEALDILHDALTQHVDDNLSGTTQTEGDTKHPYHKEIENINKAWKELTDDHEKTRH